MGKIQKIEKYLNENPEIHKTLDRFKETFTFVEMSYKERLKTYFDSEHKKYEEEKVTLNITQIKKVLEFHKIQISDELINFLFATQDQYNKRGTKSVRKLRNAVTHEMSIPDIKEIFSRKDELFSKMQEFLTAVN